MKHNQNKTITQNEGPPDTWTTLYFPDFLAKQKGVVLIYVRYN